MNSLSLRDDDDRRPRRESRAVLFLLVLLLAAVAALGVLGYRILQRTAAAEARVAALSGKVEESTSVAREAIDKAVSAETFARAAAEGRQIAEADAAGARAETDTAKQEAAAARETAARAEAEAARIRKAAEAERNRLEAALGAIAETRRTALGLVMSLGGDHLKFEFDKAELSAKDRELLSRIAGILVTAKDYTISVNGHTDDVGSAEYNQRLSERRAQAVRDYLVEAGLPAEILSVTGHGKSLPLVRGTSDAARAKNRRVELAIANTQIRYGR